MIVTSTGIVFSTARDGRFYAFDAENGDVLWSAALPMGSEGLPAVYAVRDKHYIVVNATTPNAWGIRSRANGTSSQKPGRGGYVVFALP
jgi:quinoprotein glucose dehydrogenase